MQTRSYLTGFMIVFVAGMLIGCAAVPEQSKMIPYIDYSILASCDRTLRIAEVKGGEDTLDIPKIGNKDFQEALKGALEKAGLFKQISTDHAGDYELYAEIVSQKVVPGLTAYVALFVSYRMVEAKTNQAVWAENIFSQNDAFGANQGKDAIEGAARDNLGKLINKLSELLAQKNIRGGSL